MNKTKICHLCNLGMNGKAAFLCNVLEQTDYGKYDVTILNFRKDRAVAIMQRLEKLPVTIVDPEDRSTLGYIKLIQKQFAQNRYDIVHSHIWDLSGVFLFLARLYGVPVRVAHSHNTSKAPGRYNPIKVIIRDRMIWPFLRFMIEKNANRYLACSDEAARWLFSRKIVDNKAYRVIANGIDLNVFTPAKTQKETSDLRILFAGRMVYQKNPLFALDVFTEFIKLGGAAGNAHLTMIGSGAMDKEVDRIILERGLENRVTRVPQTGHMEQYYQHTDVFLFPSHYEGLGIVLVEAQACGTKCLVSSSVPCAVQCGLAKYLDLEAGARIWAEQLSALLADQTMRIDPEKLQQFSIEHTIQQLEVSYSEE